MRRTFATNSVNTPLSLLLQETSKKTNHLFESNVIKSTQKKEAPLSFEDFQKKYLKDFNKYKEDLMVCHARNNKPINSYEESLIPRAYQSYCKSAHESYLQEFDPSSVCNPNIL
jgi:hypothetical protein